jgi:LPS export ABC transporter protein LptC
MRRTRLRAGLLVVVTLALTVIGYEVSRSIALRRARTVLDLGPDFVPNVAQHIQNFRRVKVEGGKTVWEVMADDAQYFEKTDTVIATHPRVTLFLQDGRRAHIRGTEGELGLEGSELLRATLRGDVVVELDDLVLTTDQATFDRDADQITAPGAVTLRGRTMDVKGEGMEVEVTAQQVRLLRDVHTVLRNADAQS